MPVDPDAKDDVIQVQFFDMDTNSNKNSSSPLKQMMVGRVLSFWNGPFSGAMSNFRDVNALVYTELLRAYDLWERHVVWLMTISDAIFP